MTTSLEFKLSGPGARAAQRAPSMDLEHARQAGVRRPGQLLRKYVVIFVALVSVTLLASGLLEIYFSYQEQKAGLVRLQEEKANSAATTIDQFLTDIERQIEWANQSLPGDPMVPERRREDYLRLLRQVPAVTEISYLDASGKEQLRISRLAMNVQGSEVDFSEDPKFLEAQSGKSYFSTVYFRDESEPYMTIARAESGPDQGVSVAEVNLKFVWHVVSQITVARSGYAYVVDSRGRLVAHPDISLVLQQTDMSALPQVESAGLSARDRGTDKPGQGTIAQDLEGRSVVSAHQVSGPAGWMVFVDHPLEDAFAHLYSSMILRTAVLLLAGLLLAVLASLVLARKMVTPIQALQAGAARIGSGRLDQRLEIRTGDELEALAEEFNRMTAQLRELYANLEQKVDERTRDLSGALAELEIKSQQFEVASRHKSEFLASMSHELRTPLNAVIGFSEVLLERMFGELNDKQAEYLRDILASGQHLLSLINDILDLSKVEAGRMELETSVFSLPDVLENGLTMIREGAGRRGIVLNLHVEHEVGLIEADERKVKQVVFNLLSNAVKFTLDGGLVEIRAGRVGEAVEIAIRDTGIGIAPEDRERIFEEFQQAGQGPGEAREGTGLGLALAKQFVELHRGRIWLESEIGAGSTFTFSLPVRQLSGANRGLESELPVVAASLAQRDFSLSPLVGSGAR